MTYVSEHLGMVIGLAASVLYIVAFLAAIHAVMKARTSQGAIAWAIALLSFPYLTVPLYAIFGRNRFQGYVGARQAEDLNLKQIISSLVQIYPEEKQVTLEGDLKRYRALATLVNIPFTLSGDAELLVDGHATFDAIFKGIEAAEKYILVQFFIVKDDKLGRELKRRLLEKASQGVRIYFLYDEIGSHFLSSSYVKELKREGVDIRPFRTTQGRANRFQVNFRNHRKIVIIDGLTAYVGGHNVGDEYLGEHPTLTPWRDTHVRFTGATVIAVQLSFVEDWYWAAHGVPDLNWDVDVHEGSVKTLVLPSGPADDQDTCSLMFTHLINSARKRIWIVSPYFVPDESVLSALKLASLRGVDVRVMIPEKPDHRTVYLAGFACLQEVEGTGVRIFRYRAGFLHQKVFLVDDDLAGVGTANLDNRSLRLNFEITLAFADRKFAKEMETMLEEDFKRCREVEPGELQRKPYWFQVAVRVARLLSPIL